jgi:Tfp pilus assembly protein PilV
MRPAPTMQGLRQSGVSLVEAMAALAVMAFGLLGVVGLQSTLRANADISKQRSEAVRRIQEVVEQRRRFSTVPTTVGQVAFDDIATQADVDQVATNTTFTIAETVALDANGLPLKTVRVSAVWADRASQPQSASVTTTIVRAGPELTAVLTVPAGSGVAAKPALRNPVIPKDATDLGTGESSFAPPGAGAGVSWVFDNSTGYITKYCNPTCTAVDQRLLSGFVRFSMGASQPTEADAENPTGTGSLLDLWVNKNVTAPTQAAGADRVECFERLATDSTYVEYFCAVPVGGAPVSWSGWSEVTGLTLASSIASVDNSSFRVCRYTPADIHTTATNEEHPLQYTLVQTGLTNQNFLIIRTGDGTSSFDCPNDNTATPTVNTNTHHHQPST